MGILDDAIREHLELIRSHGAADSEVQRLEDEAFGPPTRPDEEDFPGAAEAQEESGNGVPVEPAVEDRPSGDAAANEDVTTMLPAEPRDAPAETGEEAIEAFEVDERGAGEPAEPDSESVAAEPEAGEPVAEVHPVVEEPAGEPQEEPSDETPVPAEEGTSFYDQGSDPELDVDLDLQLDTEPPSEELEAGEPPSEELEAGEPPSEELEAGEPPSEELEATEPPSEEHDLAEPEGAMPLEPPIESLDTVEHPFPEEVVEPRAPGEEPPPSDEHAVREEPPPEEEEEPTEEGEDGEDVLADTPEFLKDAPEDDELWFEQGEPKDFDF